MTTTASGNVPAPDRRKVLEWLGAESGSGRICFPQDVIAVVLRACAHPSLKGNVLEEAWADLESRVSLRDYAADEFPGDRDLALYEDRAGQALTLLTDGRGHASKSLIEETARRLDVGYLLDSRLPVPDRDVARQAPGTPV